MKEDFGKVSIIIPLYNGSSYIEKCYESLKKQKYKNFEAIFIDDGSNDNSIEILKKISIEDERIKIIHIKKSGVSTARNIGIKNAKGKYLSFLDVDDTYKENYLSVLVKEFNEKNVDIILCNYEEIYKENKKNIILPWKNEILNREKIMNELIPRMVGIKEKNETIIRSLVWRTFTTLEFYKKTNVKFDPKVEVAEDMLLLTELYSKANKIFISSKILYNYNRYSNTTLSSYIKNCIEKNNYFHKTLVKLLKEIKIYNKIIDRYATNRFMMYVSMLSNAVRNPKKTNIKKEIQDIVEIYQKDSICKNNLPKKIPLKWKPNIFLLKHKNINLLKILYYFREQKKNMKKI